ncbi:hypothetical protein MA16_Dca027914 [Dendrobium catenatum]|uniref:Uncharacterized protein n=1 Tax=Dendrobium catenatum TaxID=906689 RepID=A0A2I0VCC3_9ASPA|nr:hypothetical protein MA16_Dca027914 [Dendrobium catenatum]
MPSSSLSVVKKGNRRDPKPSPAHLLAPKVLKFSDKNASVQKTNNKQSRNSIDHRTKLMGNFGPLQKLLGVRRSKKFKEEFASSSMEQCVNVIDNSVDGKLKEVDFVGQWQGVYSEFFCGGDASPLVGNG